MTVIKQMYGNPVMSVKGICEQFSYQRSHSEEVYERN